MDININKEIWEVVLPELELLKQRISSNIVSTGRKASGKTIESLKVVENETGGMLSGRKYFGTLETGRKAGKAPYNFVSIISQWMKDKGISADPIPYLRKPSEKWQPKYTPQQRGDMSLAGAIANKIKTEGTKLHRDGGDDAVYSLEIPKTIKSIRLKLSDLFVVYVVEQIKLNIK